jgi:regulator of protease activity HflC (stomatin/prohibitin superfamily)
VVTTVLIVVIALVVLLVGSAVRMVQQYQRGVVLRFGRLLPEVRQPGLRLMIPVADRMVKVPVQTIVMDVPPQGAITKDNVTLSVDAVVYFRVTDPVKAVVNVENYLGAISQVARTSLRSVIGRADLDTMLSDREQVNAELRAVIDTPTDDWGITVDRVEIKDIALPETMRRAMAHQAEAERDRRARVIAADGEHQASTRLADAARVMADTPAAAAAPADRLRRGFGPEQHTGDAAAGGTASLLRAEDRHPQWRPIRSRRRTDPSGSAFRRRGRTRSGADAHGR